MTRIKVLVIDDSAVVREILRTGLATDPDIEVVGVASDAFRARELILSQHPDVLTLDVEMPRMDGIVFLKKLMPQYPLPVVMVSSLTGPGAMATLEALEYGAVDVVHKPSTALRVNLTAMVEDLCEKVKAASTVDVSRWRNVRSTGTLPKIPSGALFQSTDKVVAIGASTGGTVALRSILMALPADMPGTVIVQHMPPVFTKLFAEKLNEECQVQVKEAESGDRLTPGRVLIAPGGLQTTVTRSGGDYRVQVRSGDRVNGHAPSVDVLFNSVAHEVGPNAVGVVLTGMGRDGASGLLRMRQAGARTFSQDEASSLIYGMPMEAWAQGGSEKQVSLDQVPQELLAVLKRMHL